MWWIVGLLLMGVFGRALAQDISGRSEQMEADFLRVYQQDVRIAPGCHTPVVLQR
jgi:hypothetical protein